MKLFYSMLSYFIDLILNVFFTPREMTILTSKDIKKAATTANQLIKNQQMRRKIDTPIYSDTISLYSRYELKDAKIMLSNAIRELIRLSTIRGNKDSQVVFSFDWDEELYSLSICFYERREETDEEIEARKISTAHATEQLRQLNEKKDREKYEELKARFENKI